MASTYKMVAYGSQGDAVRQLQSELNKHGYQLDEDGIFGSKTKAAVQDYQKKNSLRLDGIAGDETWGSLMAAPAAAAETGEETEAAPVARPSAKTAQALAKLERGYTPSEDVTAAQAYRDSVAALRPDAYASAYEQQLAALYQDLTGRQPFSYDPETDDAFTQYARIYRQKGRAAMEDTMGQAAALTGGYGSSYAENAGQQAYGQYMQELMALLPQFREQAREAYDKEEQALRERYDLLDKQERADYARWQDGMSAWEKQLSLAQEQYDSTSRRTESCMRRCWPTTAAWPSRSRSCRPPVRRWRAAGRQPQAASPSAPRRRTACTGPWGTISKRAGPRRRRLCWHSTGAA